MVRALLVSLKKYMFKSDFDKSSIRRAELTKIRRSVQNAESSFRRHLCNAADDASSVEDRSADQNHILIAVVARWLHNDVPPDNLTFWVLDGFTTLKYTYPHLRRNTVKKIGDVPPLKNAALFL